MVGWFQECELQTQSVSQVLPFLLRTENQSTYKAKLMIYAGCKSNTALFKKWDAYKDDDGSQK